MTRITVVTEIDAPPEQVWRVVEPIQDHVRWMRDAVAIRFEGDQTAGVGTRFVCATKVGPIRLDDRMEITEWVPGEVMGVRHAGVVTGTGRFTLTPIDLARRTRFSWSEELRFPWWLGGRLGEAVGGKPVMSAIWRHNLRALKALVESSG
jgi:uncharacterized protein YndB with AHSA1/START domain